MRTVGSLLEKVDKLVTLPNCSLVLFCFFFLHSFVQCKHMHYASEIWMWLWKYFCCRGDDT